MNYKTPGVYVEEISLLPPSVAGVETGIPAFIGYTEKAETPDGKPITKPTRINSLLDYVALFGKAQPEDDLVVTLTDYLAADGTTVVNQKIEAGFDSTPTAGPSPHNMYYALQLYFANGGGPCYIISVGKAEGSISDAKLAEGLTLLEGEDEPTMIVIPEAIHLSSTNHINLMNKCLKQCNDLKDRVTLVDVQQKAAPGPTQIFTDIETTFRTGNLQVDYLRFGAAYYPPLDTTIDFDYSGKEGLLKIIHNRVKSDGTPDNNSGDLDGTFLDSLSESNNLLYEKCKQQISEVTMTLPASPAMAGVYARVDAERGVWKAPANVGLAAVIRPSVKITDADQDYMNVDPTSGKSVNAIRQITGRGPAIVWGARTLAGNDNEWRYINVRRFFNFVEESVKKATYRFVFEPNDANTWVKVRAMIENFLTLQWRAGALQGAKPEQAFFVRVGLNQTMLPIDVLEGRLIVDIGMAVVRPAEFIILRFMHKLPES